MDMLNTNGIWLHYKDTGRPDAPAIVFINSLGTDFRVWDPVVPALTDRFRVILYDKRGHGLSDAPDGPYAMADQVADLAELLDARGIDKAIVCGLSVGGLIAQGFAAAHPERVRGLILSGTAARIGDEDRWNNLTATIRHGGIEAVADTILARWFPEDFHKDNPGEIAAWRNMLTRTPVEGYLGTVGTLRDTDLTGAAKEIAAPTLCLVGDQDGSTPPEMVRALADLIPGADYEMIEGTGHLPGIVRPDAVAGAIAGFCEKHGLI